MRKIIILFLSIALALSMAACSNGSGSNSGGNDNQEESITLSPEAGQSSELNTTEEVKAAATQTNEMVKIAAISPNSPKKTIVFTTFDYDDVYPKVKKYEKQHPNIKIELKYVDHTIGNNDPIARNEKFVKTLNTQLLSGKGPDLIDTSFLDIDQYVKQKLLDNLSDRMAKDPTFKKEQYFNNILDQVKVGGSIYGMPLNFTMRGLYGDEAAIEKTGVKFDDKSWNWNDFTKVAKELAQKGNNKYVLWKGNNTNVIGLKGSVNELFARVQGNYFDFVDEVNKKAYFDSASFTGMLKEVKAMYDEKIITDDYKNRGKTYFEEDSISPQSYALKLKELGDAPYNYKKPKLFAAPTGSDQKPGISFMLDSKLSINANSSVKAEAWDFIKFLLSEDSESTGPLSKIDMIPLNKAVYERQVKELLKTGKVKGYDAETKEIKITEKDIQVLDTFISRAVYRGTSSSRKIGEIVFTESQAYYTGQKSAEAVSKLIQKKVMLYLNE